MHEKSPIGPTPSHDEPGQATPSPVADDDLYTITFHDADPEEKPDALTDDHGAGGEGQLPHQPHKLEDVGATPTPASTSDATEQLVDDVDPAQPWDTLAGSILGLASESPFRIPGTAPREPFYSPVVAAAQAPSVQPAVVFHHSERIWRTAGPLADVMRRLDQSAPIRVWWLNDDGKRREEDAVFYGFPDWVATDAEPPAAKTDPDAAKDELGAPTWSDSAVNAAANRFLSFLPNNNRAVNDADRYAAREILRAAFEEEAWQERRGGTDVPNGVTND